MATKRLQRPVTIITIEHEKVPRVVATKPLAMSREGVNYYYLLASLVAKTPNGCIRWEEEDGYFTLSVVCSGKVQFSVGVSSNEDKDSAYRSAYKILELRYVMSDTKLDSK